MPFSTYSIQAAMTLVPETVVWPIRYHTSTVAAGGVKPYTFRIALLASAWVGLGQAVSANALAAYEMTASAANSPDNLVSMCFNLSVRGQFAGSSRTGFQRLQAPARRRPAA